MMMMTEEDIYKIMLPWYTKVGMLENSVKEIQYNKKIWVIVGIALLIILIVSISVNIYLYFKIRSKPPEKS